jgi:hypothetical protein
MASGVSKTMQATYTVVPGPTTAIVNTASASSSSTPDPIATNNSASVTTSTGCPTAAPSGLSPADGATNVPTAGTFFWSGVNASGYTIFLEPAGPNATCSTFFAATGVTNQQYFGLQPGTTYQWRVEAHTPGCPTFTAVRFDGANCPTTAALTSPLGGTVNGT